ncbi:MAG: tetrahydrodipicolinate N-succinyltransferase N-terminal domain-containing protein [Candidatus Gracilibacteria bacterium]|nr:tetrahydrodipicolinate N-succinyltransferase N-terminal domain-containing protein [Candidatus Gracilibacteria bacterium]
MKKIITDEAGFKAFVKAIQEQKDYKNPLGFGICRVDVGQLDKTKVLQATFPHINWNENFGSAAIFIAAAQEWGYEVNFTADELIIPINSAFLQWCLDKFTPYIDEAFGDAHKNVQVVQTLLDVIEEKGMRDAEFRLVMLFNDVPCTSVEGTYLKLYALSTSKAELRSLNLNGAFGTLHNVAWSDGQPIELEWLRENEIELKFANAYPKIDFVDKFPRYLQHIIPDNSVRILDDSKVRFGAQLAKKTTIMPGASYVNFNAGTQNRRDGEENKGVMDEGRISSSAVVGDGSDIGGGASILGVLSGTDGIPVTIGQDCLLGANSVTGIALGDGCIVDAGIAVLAGTKFSVEYNELEKLFQVNPSFEEFPCVDEDEKIILNSEVEGGDIAPMLIEGKAETMRELLEKSRFLERKIVLKGKELVALNGIHFRQDSTTGQLIIRRSTREVKLNADLH